MVPRAFQTARPSAFISLPRWSILLTQMAHREVASMSSAQSPMLVCVPTLVEPDVETIQDFTFLFYIFTLRRHLDVTHKHFSPLPDRFMPIAQQRRQQIFDDAALTGLDLDRHRHAGREA